VVQGRKVGLNQRIVAALKPGEKVYGGGLGQAPSRLLPDFGVELD